MRNKLPVILVFLAAAALVLSGCSSGSSGGTPKAAAPTTVVDFGNVPVSNDMKDARVKEFTIKNEGTANLKLSDIQVKTLEGC